jgi:hypothetical protein
VELSSTERRIDWPCSFIGVGLRSAWARPVQRRVSFAEASNLVEACSMPRPHTWTSPPSSQSTPTPSASCAAASLVWSTTPARDLSGRARILSPTRSNLAWCLDRASVRGEPRRAILDLDAHPVADGGRVDGAQPPNVVVGLDGDDTAELAAARSYGFLRGDLAPLRKAGVDRLLRRLPPAVAAGNSRS